MTYKKTEIAVMDQISIVCDECWVGQICDKVELGVNENSILKNDVREELTLKKGTVIAEENSPFTSLYAITSGTLRSHITRMDGQQQVVAFHFPGEIVGIDGIAIGEYRAGIRVLENCTLCEFPYDKFKARMNNSEKIQDTLMQIISRGIVREREQMMVHGNCTAQGRVAAFFLYLIKQYEGLGAFNVPFRLSMPRIDIASYLGLATETVSRQITKMQEKHIIAVRGKIVKVIDLDKLKKLAVG